MGDLSDLYIFFRVASRLQRVPNGFLANPGLGLYEGRDSGFLRKRRTRFGIVIMTGTQD